MTQPDLEDTQPSKTQNQPRHTIKSFWIWILVTILLFSITIPAGVLAGYQTGKADQDRLRSEQALSIIQEQFQLGMLDLNEGRYQVARQRFEYVLTQDPAFPGVTEQLAAVLTILNATATPSPLPPPTATATLTPTPDLRPLEERITQAFALIVDQGWGQAIDILVGLRQQDPNYQVTRVDRLLYLALRQRGVNKILQESNLEGGIYDLTLAENFGPIDVEAETTRNLARIYLIGSSFWEAYPAQAVYYFSQVAASAPYLRDASGWTAMERYRGALIQYGDQFMREGDGCQALEQYQLAAGIRTDQSLMNSINNATLQCYPPTEEITATSSPTPSPTPTTTPLETFQPTPTIEPPPTDTEVPAPTETETPAPLPSDAPPPPPPSETPEPSPASAP